MDSDVTVHHKTKLCKNNKRKSKTRNSKKQPLTYSKSAFSYIYFYNKVMSKNFSLVVYGTPVKQDYHISFSELQNFTICFFFLYWGRLYEFCFMWVQTQIDPFVHIWIPTVCWNIQCPKKTCFCRRKNPAFWWYSYLLHPRRSSYFSGLAWEFGVSRIWLTNLSELVVHFIRCQTGPSQFLTWLTGVYLYI